MFWQTRKPPSHATSPTARRSRRSHDLALLDVTAEHVRRRRPRRAHFRPGWPGWSRTVSGDGMSEDGMSTVEYAIGTIAAAAFAAVLYAVVTGDSIVSGLTSLVQHALTVSF